MVTERVGYSPRRLGRTNQWICPLALGTVELGMDYGLPAAGHYQRPTDADGIRLVQAAIDAGINFIDTARAYGESERVLGQALAGRRSQVVLATKAVSRLPGGALPTGLELQQHLLGQLDESLANLQTDYVDVWKIHNVLDAELTIADDLRTVFDQACRSGKILATGGSFYGADLPLRALQLDLFDAIQITYSVLDQRVQDAVLPLAQDLDVGVIARSVLLKGVLTEQAEHLPASLATLKERSRQFRQRVEQAGEALTPAQAAVVFALVNPGLHAVLVGMRSLDELQQNLRTLEASIPGEVIQHWAELRLDDPKLLDPSQWGV